MHADYNLTQQLLKDAVEGLNPAMLHGAITGFICSGAAADRDIFPELFESSFPSVVLQLVERLDQETRIQLSSPDYEFQPMLPTDEIRLNSRLQALSCWCDWFNIGFAAGFMRPQEDIGAELMEILNDFGNLAEAEDIGEQTDEQDEADYMELTEYVRMAAVSIFLQLNSPDSVPTEEDDELPGEQPLFADPDDDPMFH